MMLRRYVPRFALVAMALAITVASSFPACEPNESCRQPIYQVREADVAAPGATDSAVAEVECRWAQVNMLIAGDLVSHLEREGRGNQGTFAGLISAEDASDECQ